MRAPANGRTLSAQRMERTPPRMTTAPWKTLPEIAGAAVAWPHKAPAAARRSFAIRGRPKPRRRDRRRRSAGGDVVEVAAVLFEVRVLRTREAVSRLVLLLLIDLRIVRSDGRFRSLTVIAAGFVIGTGIFVAVVPIAVAGALLGEVCAFPFGERELGGRQDEAGFANLLDQRRPGVLDAAARKDAVSAGLGLERASREARKELLGSHVGHVGVGADRLAVDAGSETAADAIGGAAAQHGLKNLDRRRLDERRVRGQLAALGDHAGDRLDRGVFVGADGDVVRRQSEHEKPDERLAGQPLASERLDERLGAHLADHLAALLGDVGTCPRLSGRSIPAIPGAGLRRLCGGGRRREIDLADRAVSRVDGERDAVMSAGLAAPDPGRALRELGSAVVVDLNDFPVLRNVGFEPGELCANESVDVGRVSAVLVGRGE